MGYREEAGLTLLEKYEKRGVSRGSDIISFREKLPLPLVPAYSGKLYWPFRVRLCWTCKESSEFLIKETNVKIHISRQIRSPYSLLPFKERLQIWLWETQLGDFPILWKEELFFPIPWSYDLVGKAILEVLTEHADLKAQ